MTGAPPALDPAAANRSGVAPGGLIEQLVAGVRSVLEAELPQEVAVVDFPAKPTAFDVGDREAVAMVHYTGSRYAAPATNGAPSQARTAGLDVHLVVRGLDGRTGAVALVEAVRLALQGRQLGGAGAIVVLRDGFVGERAGLWDYAVTVEAPVLALARRPPPFAPLSDRPASAPSPQAP